MAEEVGKESYAELKSRQEASRARLEELRLEAANGRREYIERRDAAVRPRSENADRNKVSARQRTRPAKDDNADAFRPSGGDGDALANSGAQYGGVSASRSRTQRVSSGPASGNRQTAGQETSAVQGIASLEWWEKRAKRILTYAGFDLKGDAQALSEVEAQRLRPIIANWMQEIGMAMDWCIWHLNGNKEECDIWMFSEEEALTLATIYLKRAKKVGWMAQAARQAEHLKNVGDIKPLAQIIGKRAIATPVFIGTNGGLHPWMRKER